MVLGSPYFRLLYGKIKKNMDCYYPQQQNVRGFPLFIHFDYGMNVLQCGHCVYSVSRKKRDQNVFVTSSIKLGRF